MSRLADKAIAHERRRAGETALSDFADYVEKAQSTLTATSTSQPSTNPDLDHDELSILETLGLADSAPAHSLRDLLLSPDGKPKLKELLEKLCQEGRGECLFDVGTEVSLESCGFTREEWEMAMERVRDVAGEMEAGVTMLMTKGVGGEVEVGEEKEGEGVSAKVLVRRRPRSMEELLEIRVAVVGNGKPASKIR